jgi:hypothetical protein
MADEAADEAVDFLPAELTYDPVADGTGVVDEADEAARRRRRARRTRTIVLGAMLAVLLGLAVVFGPTAWEIFLQKDTTLAAPQKIAGLTLDTTEDAQSTADYLKTALAAGVALDSSLGAVYTDGGGSEHSVIIVGGTGLFLSPEKQLDAAFGLITDDTGGVTGVRTVPAGPLGGVMKCGTTTTDDESTIPVCGWADHGSLAVALFPGRALDESAELLRQMRTAMQHR